MNDLPCICEGNWRLIKSEVVDLIGKKLMDTNNGLEYTLFGIVDGEDDYYYGICDDRGGFRLLSCVGNLQSWGLEPV